MSKASANSAGAAPDDEKRAPGDFVKPKERRR